MKSLRPTSKPTKDKPDGEVRDVLAGGGGMERQGSDEEDVNEVSEIEGENDNDKDGLQDAGVEADDEADQIGGGMAGKGASS